ncbi:MAG: hypothetical protein LBC31_12630 [Treponema sp.]|jgi:hypothetical protein|nr:hypothetical protein [Treponema sp.]
MKLAPEQRSLLLCLAWIGAVIAAGGLLWYATQSYRTRLLAAAVNKALVRAGDARRVGSALSSGGFSAAAVRGSWFEVIGSGQRAFVFTVTRSGAASACVALVDGSGNVENVIPLSPGAARVMEELPPPLYRFYVRRIEKAAAGAPAAGAGGAR